MKYKINKIQLIIGLLLIFLFIFVFLIFLSVSKNKVADINFDNVEAVTPSNEVREKLDILDQDLNKNQLKDEFKVEEKSNEEVQEKEDLLIMNSVSKNGDIDLCDNIENDEIKINCLDNGYALKSSKEKSSSYCLKISDGSLKSRCLDNFYYNIALLKSMYQYCIKIESEDLKNKCYYNIILPIVENVSYDGDSEICNLLDGSHKDYCISLVTKKLESGSIAAIISSDNLSSCDTLNDQNLKNTCYDSIYFNKAYKENDISQCSLIKNSQKREVCLSNLSKNQDDNYLKEAISKNDINICKKIFNTETKQNCNDNINFKNAIGYKDEQLCGDILNTLLKKQCLDFFISINSK